MKETSWPRFLRITRRTRAIRTYITTTMIARLGRRSRHATRCQAPQATLAARNACRWADRLSGTQERELSWRVLAIPATPQSPGSCGDRGLREAGASSHVCRAERAKERVAAIQIGRSLVTARRDRSPRMSRASRNAHRRRSPDSGDGLAPLASGWSWHVSGLVHDR